MKVIEGRLLTEVQEEMRLNKMFEFGRIEVKKDCKNCKNGWCDILKDLYCRYSVCHFYDKKD